MIVIRRLVSLVAVSLVFASAPARANHTQFDNTEDLRAFAEAVRFARTELGYNSSYARDFADTVMASGRPRAYLEGYRQAYRFARAADPNGLGYNTSYSREFAQSYAETRGGVKRLARYSAAYRFARSGDPNGLGFNISYAREFAERFKERWDGQLVLERYQEAYRLARDPEILGYNSSYAREFAEDQSGINDPVPQRPQCLISQDTSSEIGQLLASISETLGPHNTQDLQEAYERFCREGRDTAQLGRDIVRITAEETVERLYGTGGAHPVETEEVVVTPAS